MGETDDREAKTEEATEKRIADAAKKGQLPFSREVPVFLSACATWIALIYLTADLGGGIALAVRPFWEWPGAWSLETASDASSMLMYLVETAALPLLPMMCLIGAAGLVGSLAQSRGVSAERIKPQISRISPGSGWRRVFGRDGLGHALKSTIGLLAVACVGSISLLELLKLTISRHEAEPGALVAALPQMSARLLMFMLAAMLVVAVIDTVLSRGSWLRGLRMTKQEVKDEAKEVDGNPQVKQRMRFLARKRSRKRMLAAVPRATVVVTNPTHYAVALRYVSGETAAPIVVAKGTDRVALRIREIAGSHRIPVVEDQPLARALHASAEVDAAIPPELYRAVARIILFVDKTAVRATIDG